jgi:hypothetical protein
MPMTTTRESMGLTDEVAHLFVLGLEVAFKGGLARNGGGDTLCDGDACAFERGDLFWIVGHEAHGANAEELENFRGQLELAVVGAVAESVVGFDGVEPGVLELVGAEFGHEADAAAFLLLVEQDTGALVGYAGEREVELVVAVAAQGVEDVSGEALRMDADDGRSGVNVSEDKRDGGLDALLRRGVVKGGRPRVSGIGDRQDAFEAEDAEVCPAGREVGFGHFADTVKRHNSIIDSRGGAFDSLASASMRKRLRRRVEAWALAVRT